MVLMLLIAFGVIFYYFIDSQRASKSNVKVKIKNEKKENYNLGGWKLYQCKDEVKNYQQKILFEKIAYAKWKKQVEALEKKWRQITHVILPMGLVASFFLPFLFGLLLLYLMMQFIFVKCHIIHLKNKYKKR